ncbi:MAG: exodeoxyribonuclease VII large subunit [Alphaproteobacteria bacterium]|nr:exodeoxyribonuclease VII large subunit [Alphaproteobacteria bacterium]
MYTNSSTNGNSLNKVYSVTEISNLLKGVVEDHFTGIRVRGELSSVKRHSSGHLYFSLKDEKAILDGICWKGVATKLATQPQDGLEVICIGRLTTFPGRSKYQMVVETMEVAGEGALLKLLEDLKKKLAAEGLFSQATKKAIPFLPKKIGIITSPTGAVIQDILHRLQDRFPTPVLLWPVAVQGQDAAPKIAAAIEGFNSLPTEQRPDVLIVARGGGSLEDLWCFNEECVVRAAANSRIPLISAVGHETDTTLIDYASDHRAPTPTAAAERAVPVRLELRTRLTEQARSLNQSMRRLFEETTQRLDDRSERLLRSTALYLREHTQCLEALKIRSPLDLVLRQNDLIAALYQRLVQAVRNTLLMQENHLKSQSQLLKSYSYTGTLERGFSLIKTTSGDLVRRAKSLLTDDIFQVHFIDGKIDAKVIEPSLSPKKTKKRPPSKTTPPSLCDAPQPSFFD